MLEVKIPVEIHDYKSKVIAGLSLRQLIAIAGAMVTALPIGIFGNKFLSEDIVLWVVILVAAPWVLYGFKKFQGLKFEDYMRVLISQFFNSKKRVYEDTDESIFQELHISIIEDKLKPEDTNEENEV